MAKGTDGISIFGVVGTIAIALFWFFSKGPTESRWQWMTGQIKALLKMAVFFAVLGFVYWCATDHTRTITAAGTWLIFFVGVGAWAHFSSEAEKYKNWLKPDYKAYREEVAKEYGQGSAPEMFGEYDSLTGASESAASAGDRSQDARNPSGETS